MQPAGLRLFTDAEVHRRRDAALALLDARGLDALVAYGTAGAHPDVQWLSGYPVSNEAAVVLPARGEPALFVNYFNHLATARRLAVLADVRRAGDDIASTLAGEIRARGLRRLGLVGPLPFGRYEELRRALGHAGFVDLGPDFYRLRLIRSPEEVAVIREAARLTDRSLAELLGAARVGTSELELAAAAESCYLADGGRNGIHYIGVNSPVPGQFPTPRRLAAGDVVSVELSTSLHGYWGQVLRTFVVADEGGHEHRRMHAVAEEAYAAVSGVIRGGGSSEDALEAAEVIERSGFTIVDDLLHMGGGGVYAPYLRTREAAHGPQPRFDFEAGMAVVVQPNVVSDDHRSGVQTGELLLVTGTGVDMLHRAPRGLLQAGQ